MTARVYKIARRGEWDDAEKIGIFTGSPDDKRDGYIHLSSAGQVRSTCDKWFAGQDNLLLVILEADRLGASLKWEASRNGESFPHLYADLLLSAVHSIVPIRRGTDGRPIFPPEIP